jgi:hypothetical protein
MVSEEIEILTENKPNDDPNSCNIFVKTCKYTVQLTGNSLLPIIAPILTAPKLAIPIRAHYQEGHKSLHLSNVEGPLIPAPTGTGISNKIKLITFKWARVCRGRKCQRHACMPNQVAVGCYESRRRHLPKH